MPDTKKLFSSKLKRLADFDGRLVSYEEFREGAERDDALHRGRYSEELVAAIDPVFLTTDGVRYMRESLTEIKAGERLRNQDIQDIRRYWEAQAGQGMPSGIDRELVSAPSPELMVQIAAKLGFRKYAEFSELMYLETSDGERQMRQQILAFGVDEEGQQYEFGAGAISFHKSLGTELPTTPIGAAAYEILPMASVIERLEVLNPAWSLGHEEPVVRALTLMPAPQLLAAGSPPMFLAVTVTNGAMNVIALNASNLTVIGSAVLLMSASARRWLRTSLDVLCKIFAIAGLVNLIIATALAAAAAAPSVGLALALSFVIVAEIAAIIYRLIGIVTEIMGPANPQVKKVMARMGAIKKKLAKLQADMEAGRVDPKAGAKQLEEIGDEYKDVMDDVSDALKGEDCSERVDDVIDDTKDAIDRTVKAPRVK